MKVVINGIVLFVLTLSITVVSCLALNYIRGVS